MTLKLNPTPKEFATAWSQGYETALQPIAKNGEVPYAEVDEDQIGGTKSVFADNADHWLNIYDDKNKLSEMVKAGYKYALKEGTKVAGSDGKISLLEARAMAADLVEDFYALSGKPFVEPTSVVAPALRKATKQAFEDGDYTGAQAADVKSSDWAALPFAIRKEVEDMDKSGTTYKDERTLEVKTLTVKGEQTYGVHYSDSDGIERFAAFKSDGTRIAGGSQTESSGWGWH
jgi:hypothetical protein